MSDATEATGGPIRMRHGMLWLTAGSALLIGTYTFSTNEVSLILAYGLLVLGLYLAVLGVEKMIGGYLAGIRTADPAIVRSVRRAGAVCLLLAAAVGSSGYIAYSAKVPYWNSIESFAAEADVRLRFHDIIKRHSESLESRVAGEEGLRLWRESAEAGLAMRERISAVLEGARYLAEHAEGDLRKQAETLEPFYAVCMEWIDFYERIERAFEEESMIEPRDEWAEEHNRLHDKLHVQPQSTEGS